MEPENFFDFGGEAGIQGLDNTEATQDGVPDTNDATTTIVEDDDVDMDKQIPVGRQLNGTGNKSNGADAKKTATAATKGKSSVSSLTDGVVTDAVKTKTATAQEVDMSKPAVTAADKKPPTQAAPAKKASTTNGAKPAATASSSSSSSTSSKPAATTEKKAEQPKKPASATTTSGAPAKKAMPAAAKKPAANDADETTNDDDEEEAKKAKLVAKKAAEAKAKAEAKKMADAKAKAEAKSASIMKDVEEVESASAGGKKKGKAPKKEDEDGDADMSAASDGEGEGDAAEEEEAVSKKRKRTKKSKVKFMQVKDDEPLGVDAAIVFEDSDEVILRVVEVPDQPFPHKLGDIRKMSSTEIKKALQDKYIGFMRRETSLQAQQEEFVYQKDPNKEGAVVIRILTDTELKRKDLRPQPRNILDIIKKRNRDDNGYRIWKNDPAFFKRCNLDANSQTVDDIDLETALQPKKKNKKAATEDEEAEEGGDDEAEDEEPKVKKPKTEAKAGKEKPSDGDSKSAKSAETASADYKNDIRNLLMAVEFRTEDLKMAKDVAKQTASKCMKHADFKKLPADVRERVVELSKA